MNGGSQNTLQPGLLELAAQARPCLVPPALCGLTSPRATPGVSPPVHVSQASPPVYVLGTDFKAGQTKAKTAIVEYLRAIGLRWRPARGR